MKSRASATSVRPGPVLVSENDDGQGQEGDRLGRLLDQLLPAWLLEGCFDPDGARRQPPGRGPGIMARLGFRLTAEKRKITYQGDSSPGACWRCC